MYLLTTTNELRFLTLTLFKNIKVGNRVLIRERIFETDKTIKVSIEIIN